MTASPSAYQAAIDKLLGEIDAVQAAGEGRAALRRCAVRHHRDRYPDRQAIANREPVQVTKRGAATGDYESRGPKRITVEACSPSATPYFGFRGGQPAICVVGRASP